MADYPLMPFWTDRYLSDTVHLSTVEHGAYLLLLFAAWRSPDCALPDDDAVLAKITKTGRQWPRVKRMVMPYWRKRSDGQWEQKGQVKVRTRVCDQSEAQRSKALKRWNGHDAGVMPNKSRGNAGAMPPKPKPNPILPLTPSRSEPAAVARSPDGLAPLAGQYHFKTEENYRSPPQPNGTPSKDVFVMQGTEAYDEWWRYLKQPAKLNAQGGWYFPAEHPPHSAVLNPAQRPTEEINDEVPFD